MSGRIKSYLNGPLLHVRKLKKKKKHDFVFWNIATVSWVHTDVSEEAAHITTHCYIPKTAAFIIA